MRERGRTGVATNGKPQQDESQEEPVDHTALLSELVSHLRDKRTHLREQWARRIADWRKDERSVYVYFDNDIKSAAPGDAQTLLKLLDED